MITDASVPWLIGAAPAESWGSSDTACLVILAIAIAIGGIAVWVARLYLNQTDVEKGLEGQVELYCKSCGNAARPIRNPHGSLLGVADGSIVAARVGSPWACRKCFATDLIPTDSPVAVAAMAQLRKDGREP